MSKSLLVLSALLGATNPATRLAAGGRSEFSTYGGGAYGQRYSPLTQIDKRNVASLQVAWRVDMEPGQIQTQPLIVGDTLFVISPSLKVMALDATTGARRWLFDPGFAGTQPSRGLTYWSDGRRGRVLVGIMNYIYALDAGSGRPVAGFGAGGRIDLRDNLRGDAASFAAYSTSPGVIYRDLFIVGFRTAESRPAAPGAIRAFDARTGRMRWAFNTIPHAGEPGSETWQHEPAAETGGANAWAGMVLDDRRGIVYAPTGSATDDFYGADRLGDDLFANTLLALDAATGRKLWHFQAVHHDLWDRDFSSPPVLLTVRRGGRTVDAVAQPTKQGMLFVLDRVTGQPVFPVEERPFPASVVAGERASTTQPVPSAPEPFARQRLRADLLTDRTPAMRLWAQQQFATLRSEGQFVPMSVDRQTVVFPGFDGGAEWGGPAVDPRRGVIFVNSNDVAWTGSLVSGGTAGTAGSGESAYQNLCSGCHGADRSGSPPTFPSLVAAAQTLSESDISGVIRGGKGRMPGFPFIDGKTLPLLVKFVRSGRDEASPTTERAEVVSPASASSPAYRFSGYRKFLDPEGYPAVKPPWGTLNAIDLNTGAYLWKVPLGEYPELVAQGLTGTGSENYGGPIVTRTGILFIGATLFDRKFRAFDSGNGRLLWEGVLPYAGQATPVTYSVHGRQYVVIGTSSGRDQTAPQGSAYVAFALPARTSR